MDTPLPPDPSFDALQAAVLGAGKAGAVQTLALMAKVAEIVGQIDVWKSENGQHQGQDKVKYEGWMRACAALSTIARFMGDHAKNAPAQSIENGAVDASGQPIEQVVHLDASVLAEVIDEVLKGCRQL